MKRYISIILTIALCVCFVISPVSAAELETDSEWMEILEFSTFNDLGVNQAYFLGTQEFFYTIPRATVRYVDILFTYTENGTAPQIKLNNAGDNTRYLTIEKIDEGLYRAYGAVDNWGDTKLQFILYGSTEYYNKVEFLSIRATFFSSNSYPSSASLYVSPSAEFYYTYTPGDPALVYFQDDYTIDRSVEFYSSVTLSEWKKFDYIDVVIATRCLTLDSVSCRIGDNVIPISYSFVDGSAPGFDSATGTDDDTGGSVTLPFAAVRYVNCRVDLRSLNRTALTSSPVLVFTGTYQSTSTCYFQLTSVCGHILNFSTNPFLHIFNKIYSAVTYSVQSVVAQFNKLETWIDDMTSSIVGALTVEDSVAAEQFGDDVADKSEDLNNISGALDSVQKPDSNTVTGDVSGYVDTADVTNFAAPIVVLFDQPLILSIFMTSMTLMLSSYVLFGKR